MSYTSIKNKTKKLNELGKRIKLSDKLIDSITNPEDRIHYTQLLADSIETYNSDCTDLLTEVNKYITKERNSKVRTLGMYKLRNYLLK
jgi:hypothetical protein